MRRAGLRFFPLRDESRQRHMQIRLDRVDQGLAPLVWATITAAKTGSQVGLQSDKSRLFSR